MNKIFIQPKPSILWRLGSFAALFQYRDIHFTVLPPLCPFAFLPCTEVSYSYWGNKVNLQTKFILLKYRRDIIWSAPHWCYFKNVLIGCVQITPGVTLSIVTPANNLFFNSYFENFIFWLYVLHVLNMHVNFQAKMMLFTIWSINSSFMHYFYYKNLNLNSWLMTWLLIFNQLEILQAWKIYEDNLKQ